MLTLSEKFNDDIGGKFKILDVLNLSEEKLLQNTENFVLIADKYTENKRKINIPVACILPEQYEKEFFINIHKAWKIDCKTGKFVEIPSQNLKIENEEYYDI